MIVVNGSGLRMSVVGLNANGSVWSVSEIGRTPTAHHHLLLPQQLDHQRATIDVLRASHRARTSVPKRNVSTVARISACQVAWVV
jgi:hypothetical protein